MGLEKGGVVGDEAVAERMALVERVVGERLDDVEQRGAQVAAVARCLTPRHELLSLLGDQFPDFLATSLAKVVGFGEGVAGDLLGDAHHRLLVDHQAVGVTEHFLQIGVEVGDRLAAVLPVGVVVVHVRRHRPWPVEGDEGGYVVEAGGSERAHQRPHRTTLELEDADAGALPEQLERGLVGEVDGVDVELGIVPFADHGHAVGDHVEVAQPEEVHLQQAELFDAVHFELGHDRRLGGILTSSPACAGRGGTR